MSKLRETGLEGVAEEEMLSSESKDLYLTCGGETEKGGGSGGEGQYLWKDYGDYEAICGYKGLWLPTPDLLP